MKDGRIRTRNDCKQVHKNTSNSLPGVAWCA